MENKPSQQQPEKETVHELKTHSPFYGLIEEGKKTFEVRRNDRNYKTGDILHLKEWDMKTFYTGRECFRIITYILHGGEWGIHPDYCVMSLSSHSTAVGEEDLILEAKRRFPYIYINGQKPDHEKIQDARREGYLAAARKYREQGGEEENLMANLWKERAAAWRDLYEWQKSRISSLESKLAANK